MSYGELRVEVLNIGFGFVLLAGGLLLVLLPALYRSGKDPALITFGAGVLLYGAVTLAQLLSIRAVVPLPDAVWEYAVAFGLYLQPVPAFRFVELYWGAGRFRVFRRIWQIHLAFTVCAAGFDIATGTPAGALTVHLSVTVVWMTVFLLQLAVGGIRRNREDGAVMFGSATVAVALLHDVAANFGALPWTASLLPPATLIFVGCMAHSLLLRSLGNERRLAMIDVELQTARQFQQSLLPRALPPVSGGACAVRYLPMEAVGGDLYDFLPVGPGRFGILVADVSGHGIPAALIASMVKTGAAAQARVAERPAEVLATMNRHLYSQLDGNLVTAIYAFVDINARRVSLANAGHPHPLLLSNGRRNAEEAGTRGAALGLLPGEQYVATELTLSAGDRLVLYSDGLVEAKAPDDTLFEMHRLRTALIDHAALPADAWADQLLEQLTHWVGKTDLALDDDLTLVVLDIPDPNAGAA